MIKRIVSWKPVRIVAPDGRLTDDPHMPDLIAISYRGDLVDKIWAMPRKTPMTYEQAATMVGERFLLEISKGNIGGEKGQSHWFHRNFVEFISAEGYHIELTGDEFVPPSTSTH